jgi:hypothetical protein
MVTTVTVTVFMRTLKTLKAPKSDYIHQIYAILAFRCIGFEVFCVSLQRKIHSGLYTPNHHLGNMEPICNKSVSALCAGVSTVTEACGEPGVRRNDLRISVG